MGRPLWELHGGAGDREAAGTAGAGLSLVVARRILEALEATIARNEELLEAARANAEFVAAVVREAERRETTAIDGELVADVTRAFYRRDRVAFLVGLACELGFDVEESDLEPAGAG